MHQTGHHETQAVDEKTAAKLADLQARVRHLEADEIRPADMFNPELTYYADGTAVVMRAQDTERSGVTFGICDNTTAYPFQAVQWLDGGADLIAPHVLHRADAEQEHAESDAGHDQHAGVHAPATRQQIAQTLRSGIPTGDRHRTSIRDRLAAVALPLRLEEYHYDAADCLLYGDEEMERAVATSYVIYDGAGDRVADASINYGPGDCEQPASDLADHQAAVALLLHAPADLHALLAATDRTQRDELALLVRWATEVTQGSNDPDHALALVHRLAAWASTAAQ